ncbi:hypothetical protein AHAS_Ahas02G0201300 [Arachis hypogaea]
MDFNGMFGAEVELSDENSSDGYCGRYYASDDEGEEDEGGQDFGGEEGDPTGRKEDEHGNFSGGASHAGDGGKNRLVVAEDFLGMEFVGEQDAYLAYKEFARIRGFGVRKGDVGRVDGVLVRRDFFCHYQGTRHHKHYDRPERVREERLKSRTDCKVKLKIYYDVQRSVWKVRTIFDEHNHELAPAILILRRWCKDAKDSSRMPVITRPGHEGRMLRYAALCSATSLVARLGSEEVEDFEFARESIASVLEQLRHRIYERASGQPGMSAWSPMKDPVVPLRGRRISTQPVNQISERRDVAAPNVASQGIQRGHAAGTVHEDQTLTQGEGGLNNVSSAAMNTSSMVNRSGSPSWRPPFCGGRSGGTFFLGGQHIHQFYASQPCFGHQSEPPPHEGHCSMSPPTRATNEDLFERWLLQISPLYYEEPDDDNLLPSSWRGAGLVAVSCFVYIDSQGEGQMQDHLM